jgi:protocatechuate 3,4-dioxygenase beta subunit
MDGDDILRGRLLSRREVLALLGAGSLALIAGCGGDDGAAPATATRGAGGGASPTVASMRAATQQASGTALPSCVVRPELTQGPYFVDGQLERRDIRPDASSGEARPGTPLALALIVSQVGNDGACAPLAGAVVDVWHCDALGVYSGVQDPGFNTAGQSWLRGWQRTDSAGRAEFLTIYPGWYAGRATHIHFKVRTDPDGDTGAEFTSQLFFDDALSDRVHTQGAYASRGASGRLRNSGDGIFRQSGDQLTLGVQPSGDGYAAEFAIGVQLDA